MKIAVVSGSHRVNSQSEKISKYIENECKKISEVKQTEFILLAKNPFPLFDEDFFVAENEKWKNAWKPTSEKLASSDAIVLVTPEWHGMASSGLKNMLLLCNKNEIAHKPGLLVSVSAGTGGAFPIAEMRMSSYKNSRICYIPDHVIVRDANSVLNAETPANPADEAIRKRIAYSLSLLLEYSKALLSVRESGKLDYKNYPFGMS